VNRSAREITKSQELVYELKIGQVMTREVITVTPDTLMSELKEILRVSRISGAPVVQAGQLVGVISIEDLIKALESGRIGTTVSNGMTTDVVTVFEDESVIQAVNKFGQYGFGRLPVISRDGELVGVITQGDVVRGLLLQLDVEYQEEEIHRYRASHIFEDIESDQTGLLLRYRVHPKDFVHGGEASSKLKRALQRLGAEPQIVRRAGIATYEAETNIIIHTTNGGEIIAEIRPERIKVTAIDDGPGIEDTERAMQPGFSTAPNWIREMGFGAGMGLNNVEVCADEMSLTSKVGSGTRLEMFFHL
jgi:CBS domain-containing protein/anti-sigma regulatory factor (Ser/Thr protein kinase)